MDRARALKVAFSVYVAMLPVVLQAQFILATNNNEITIVQYTGSGGDVIIPSTTNDYPVTGIGYRAFYFYTSVSNVTIPDSVAIIGNQAFYNCVNLRDITIPGSVTNIGQSAFYNCGITNLTIDSGVTGIADHMFQGCTRLNSVIIPNSVSSIGNYAFSACFSLTNLTIPYSVTNIGNGVFSGSTGLTAITVDTNNPVYCSLDGVLFDKSQTVLVDYPAGMTGSYAIPNGVTSIEDVAFEGSPWLTGVMIPYTVTNIVNNPFYGCAKLATLTVDTNNPVYSSLAGVLFNKNQTRLIAYPTSNVGGYIIPSSVTDIGENAFYACAWLTSVTLPSGVTNIADYAFGACSRLVSIYFQGNPPTIASDVFGYDVFRYDNAVVYYLPDATGWSATFGGLPTKPWLPQIQTGGASFGVQTNQFGFNINWASGQTVIVEACTNLADPMWVPLATNNLTTGLLYFSDSQWTNYPSRFYRISSQ